MSRRLAIAKGFSLPLETTTQTIGIVAKRRVGKSYTARRIAEQLFKAGQQIVIADPKGDWWGIRSSTDGKAPGLPVVILGGERGDVPLQVDAGEVVAKLVVEERVSVLLDLSQFRKREVARFMSDFLETLYRLKAKEALRTPLMLIIDEADAIAPQKPQEGEERMLGAAEDIVRRGGQRGIGCMMITQRTAVLNKNVLTQCEMLVALRTIAPQDLKAMQAWIDVHGSVEERDTLMESLPSLPVGVAWFWSPGWPTAVGIFERVEVLPIETFDSGATPKSGEKRIEPKNLADVDLGALTRQMAATIERARADDPKLLKKAVADRDREIAMLKKQVGAAPARTVAKPVVDERAIARAVQAATAPLQKQLEQLRRAAHRVVAQLTEGGWRETADTAKVESAPEPVRVARVATAPRRSPALREAAVANASGVTPSEQKILNALAAYEVLGITPVRRVNVAFFAGYTENGHFNNMVGQLRTNGLLDYPTKGDVALTDAGRALADAGASPIASLEDLHRLWLSKISPSEAKLLRCLIETYPDSVTRADLAAATGYTENGHFNNMVGHLRSLGAADYPNKARVVATDVLFPAGLS